MKFSKSQVLMQGKSLGCLKLAPADFCYPKDMNIPWGQKAKARLKELGRTQKWLADQLGVVESAVSHWFKGTHNPHLSRIVRIAELLDMTFSELIEHDDAIAQDLEELDWLRERRRFSPAMVKYLTTLIKALPSDLKEAQAFLPPPPPKQEN